MNSALLTVAAVISVILAAVIAVQRVKYKNLVEQTNLSMKDLQEKESIMQKEAMIKAKEALHNEREQLNEDERERRREFAAIETKLSKREDQIETKIQELTDKEVSLDKLKDKIIEKEDLLDELISKSTAELERIAGMTADEAKRMLLEQLKSDLAQEQLQLIRENEAKIKEVSQEKAKEILSTTMQRCMMEQVVESTVSVVSLPNDEMKGRIIGREGRNIRTLETLTGVDLIIDDTPEAVVLSAFDPVRREIAKVALEKLIQDGRIHPVRIEETVEKSREEVEQKILTEGENAAVDMGVMGLSKELIKNLGRLYYRTSYGQNDASKKLLKFAIILLGLSLNIRTILTVGRMSLAVMFFTLLTCFGGGYFVGKALGLNWKLSNLISAGTGICGGSAIAAISTTIDADDNDIAYAMSATFLFDMAMIVLFPIMGQAMGMSDQAFGIWAGTAVNDTSSVVATGYAFSEAAGDFATMVKLTRTLAIIPTVIVFALIQLRIKRKEAIANAQDSTDLKANFKLSKIFPWFILGFLAMAIVASIFSIPSQVVSSSKSISKFLMVCALAAIGLNTSFSNMKKAGARPMIHGFIISALVVVVALVVEICMGIV